MAVKTIEQIKAQYGYGQEPHNFDDLIDTLLALAGQPTITGVSVSPASFSLAVNGETQTLTATVTGTGNFDASVTWASSNEAAATVNASGVVTPVAEGTATITATSVQDDAFSDTSAATITAEVVDTRPRLGYAPAYNGSNTAAIFAALSAVAGSSNGGKVAGSVGSPLSIAPSGVNYGWFACLSTAGAPTFNVPGLGTEVWDGATTQGQLFNPIDPGPTTVTKLDYDDGTNTWYLYRQELLLTTEQVYVS